MASAHAAPPIPLAPTYAPGTAPSPVERAPARERWSWALYDFANTIWSMNVATLYFTTWLVVDMGASNTATMWASSISSVLMAVTVPLLGAISDARRRRKGWVMWFTIASVLATMAIGLIGRSAAPLYGEGVVGATTRPESFHFGGMPLLLIALAFTVANFAYQAAQPFYNAMMPELVPPDEYGTLSGLGTAVGYVGTIAGVMLVAPYFDGTLPLIGKLGTGVMNVLHALIPTTGVGGRVSTFVPTALLFLLFSLPLFIFCRDRNPAPAGTPVKWREAFSEVGHTIQEARRHPGALRFILTTLIYQDAVGTITAVLGLYAIKAIGFRQGDVNLIFTILPVTAVFGSYVCGRLVDRIGPKRTLLGVLGAWVVLLLAMTAVPTKTAFWIIGGTVGLIFGGIPTAERPMLLSLVPQKDAGRFFSLLLLSSRAASFVGPLVWGYTVDWLEPGAGTSTAYRTALMTVAMFFFLSIFMLRGVPDPSVAAREAARQAKA